MVQVHYRLNETKPSPIGKFDLKIRVQIEVCEPKFILLRTINRFSLPAACCVPIFLMKKILDKIRQFRSPKHKQHS